MPMLPDDLLRTIWRDYGNANGVNCNLALKCMQHLVSVLRRSMRRIGLESLCQYLLQANIQITLFGMRRLVHGGRWHAIALLSILSCLLSASDGFLLAKRVLPYTCRTVRALEHLLSVAKQSGMESDSDRVTLSHPESMEQCETELKKIKQKVIKLLGFSILMCVMYVWCALKLTAVFACEDYLFNLGQGAATCMIAPPLARQRMLAKVWPKTSKGPGLALDSVERFENLLKAMNIS